MIALILHDIVPIAVALVIGIVTGLWAFRRRPAAAATLKPKTEDAA
jgi:FtsZ-interacting cell division protein ZipA